MMRTIRFINQLLIKKPTMLYPYRWPLIILLAGILLRSWGAMMKIIHWAAGDQVLLAGTIIIALGIIWLIPQLAGLKKTN